MSEGWGPARLAEAGALGAQGAAASPAARPPGRTSSPAEDAPVTPCPRLGNTPSRTSPESPQGTCCTC